LAIGTSREDDLCNDVSQDGVIVCYSISTLYMMSYITFLQALRHNFCNRRERKRNRPFTRPIFPVWRKMVWERDYSDAAMFSSCRLDQRTQRDRSRSAAESPTNRQRRMKSLVVRDWSCKEGGVQQGALYKKTWVVFWIPPCHFKPMDPLNLPYFHIMWVLKLLTSHKCHCSHPVHIRDSNHTHCLTSLQKSQLLANGRPNRARKYLHCQKWRPYTARRPFSKLICAKEERNGPPSANQGLSTAKPRSSHVTWAHG